MNSTCSNSPEQPSPQQLHERFSEYFNAGNLDGIIALYEPRATLLPQPGRAAQGIAAIREALGRVLALGGVFRISATNVARADDIALLCSNWTLDAAAPDGSPLQLSGCTTDVARLHADGLWRMAIDSPFGVAGVTG
jgi:ketosteroid isomerase-like protein